MAPAFEILRPDVSHAHRIAEIHLAAMDANPLLHAQFPTAESLAALQAYLHAHTAEEIQDPKAGVMVAHDTVDGTVVGFVKWDAPTEARSEPERAKLEAGDLKDSAGCCREYLEGYAMLAEEMKKKVWGDRPCYQVSFVCIDPRYQGRGAGAQLMREVMQRAAAGGLPVYLESTVVALPMYRRLGFQVLGSFGMAIPAEPRAETEYAETCMVWHPTSNR